MTAVILTLTAIALLAAGLAPMLQRDMRRAMARRRRRLMIRMVFDPTSFNGAARDLARAIEAMRPAAAEAGKRINEAMRAIKETR